MLVLTRHRGERIFVGENITITVMEIDGGNKVRIGIEAPKDVPIYREEVAPKKPQGTRGPNGDGPKAA